MIKSTSIKNVVKNVLAMARGTLVIDECVQELAKPLSASNIHIITTKPGEKDEQIIERLLPNRIIVTKNPDDFKGHASSYDIGIIDVSKLKFLDPNPSPTKNKTVQSISNAIIEFSLWSKRHGFIITLYDNKKPVFKELTE
jgi:hypothetical protein